MSELEDRRRAADGQDTEDDADMRQDVNIHRIYIPPFTQRVLMACCVLGVVILGWGGTNIQLMQRDIAEQKIQQAQQGERQAAAIGAILVEIATIKGAAAVTESRVGGLESRTDKLEDRR